MYSKGIFVARNGAKGIDETETIEYLFPKIKNKFELLDLRIHS